MLVGDTLSRVILLWQTFMLWADNDLPPSGGVAAALIVVGLVLAALCLIGCIASYCGYKILLKIVSRLGRGGAVPTEVLKLIVVICSSF